MAQWNQTEKILHTKIVYYGPALSGKTTNLQQVHRYTDPTGENHLISLNTASDRTLFFDLLPLDLGKISGYSVKVQLYTVPGQVRYDATRRVVLSGADAVVFVADSGQGKGPENRAAWENLKTNLKANGADPSSVSIIVQYNKQDLEGALPAKEVEAGLKSGYEGIPASALRGDGVMETFRIAVLTMLRRLSMLSGKRRVEDLAELEEQAARALDRCVMAAAAMSDRLEPLRESVAESATTIHFSDDAAGEDLLARSLRANLGIAEQFAEMRELKVRLQRRIGELEGLQTLTRELSKHEEAGSIMNDLADTTMSIPGATGMTLLARDSEEFALTPAVVRGFARDPISSGEADTEPAEELLRAGEPVLLDTLPKGSARPTTGKGPVHTSALVVPMYPVLRPACLLIVYGSAPFNDDDLRFLGLLGSHAAVCLDNVAMTTRLTAYSERLEKEVQKRTMELERANEDLRELDKMKDRFLSSVSHEMKTPLTGIISGIELLSTLTKEGDERREFVTMVSDQARHLEGLVEQILRFQLLGRHDTVANLEPVEPPQIVARILQEVSAAAASRKIEIEADVPGALPVIMGDANGLSMALREIVDNAVKFSPPGGRVVIHAREVSGQEAQAAGVRAFQGVGSGAGQARHEAEHFVVITVGDRGPGIPPEQHARIFEKFEQLGNILTAKPHGLGLGLPIAREIARRHGGDLTVDSQLGNGSEFHLYLPTAQTPAGAVAHAGASAGAER